MTSRETIIHEIQRLGEELGRSPGKNLFSKQTSIPESHWYGKYWLSWKDALAEAGLTANEIPEKIPPKTLLRHFALATRHFQKIPSEAALRMYRREHTDYPADSTFRSTFGDKKGLIAALADWIETETEFSDLFELLPTHKAATATDTTAEDGYVYLLKSGSHYKIGRSDNLEKRVKQISIALPEDVVMLHAIRTDDPSGIEAYWHSRFANRRANGEWFKLTPADLKAFKKRRYQ